MLVPFPFSDLSQSKLRPAVCLAAAGRGDWILCQVTSKRYADPSAVELDAAAFAAGGLRFASYARPAKLFTANERLVTAVVGRLTDAALERVIDAVMHILRPGTP